MTPLHRASGFTLIEALVAVTLLALLFGALMPVFQQGLAVLRSGDRHSRAVLLAESILAREIALGSPQNRFSAQQASALSAPGNAAQGEGADYRWQVTRRPFVVEQPELRSDDAGFANDAAEIPFTLVEVSVVVRWPQNEFGVQLHSLALEPSE